MKYAVQHKNGNWVSKYYTCTSNSKPAKFDTEEDAIKFISDNGKDTNWNKYYKVVTINDLSEEYYYGEETFDKYKFDLYDKIKGLTISKRRADDDLKNGLADVAKSVGIDKWDLLRYLEALRYLGYAKEIDGSYYEVSTKDASAQKDLSEELNARGERIKEGDYVKVVSGRKIPLGTIAKVTGFWTTGFGGWDWQENGEHHPIEGNQNITTYVYLDNDQRTNIDNVVKATKEEIEDATILVTPKEDVLEKGDEFIFEGNVEYIDSFKFKGNNNEIVNCKKYKFTSTKDKGIYMAYTTGELPVGKGKFLVTVKEVKYNEIRINNIRPILEN